MRSLLLLVLAGCSSSNLPLDCGARCETPSGGTTPTSIACLSQDPARCMTPNGGMQPHCDDGTPITITLCQNDGHAKCKDGAEVRCVPP